jgi:hypothetical protein
VQIANAALVTALLLAATSAQALTPVAQDRHVFASLYAEDWSGVQSDSETASAPDYAPFSAAIDGITSLPFPIPIPPIAVQTSSIEPDRLLASGNTIANPNSSVGVLVDISSESVYSVDFTLDAPHSFTLTGLLEFAAEDCAGTNGRIALSGPMGVIAEVSNSPSPFPPGCGNCQGSLPLSATGSLEPGSYTLEARGATTARGFIGPHLQCEGASTSGYEVDLALAPQVPALPPGWIPALAAALALAPRRRVRR